MRRDAQRRIKEYDVCGNGAHELLIAIKQHTGRRKTRIMPSDPFLHDHYLITNRLIRAIDCEFSAVSPLVLLA